MACMRVGSGTLGRWRQVPTAGMVVKLADKYNIELPIFRAIDALLGGRITLAEGMPLIMLRPLHDED